MVSVEWAILKKLTNSKFAKYTIAIPIVGWVLIYNDNLINIINRSFATQIDVSISWRLHVFYVGLAFIAITAILYIIFSPDEVDAYRDRHDFITQEMSIYTRKYDEDISVKAGYDRLKWKEPNIGVGGHNLEMLVNANDEQIIDKLSELYRIRNIAYPIVRWVSIIMFVVGSILISIPTVATLGWSACSVVRALPHDFPLRGYIQYPCATNPHG